MGQEHIRSHLHKRKCHCWHGCNKNQSKVGILKSDYENLTTKKHINTKLLRLFMGRMKLDRRKMPHKKIPVFAIKENMFNTKTLLPIWLKWLKIKRYLHDFCFAFPRGQPISVPEEYFRIVFVEYVCVQLTL